MALHLIHNANPALIARAKKLIAEDDCIIFMHTDVAQLEHALTTLPKSISVHVLDSQDDRHIGMEAFVALTAAHQPVLSWFQS